MLGKGKAEDYLLVSPTGATHQLGGFVGKTRIAGGACEVPPGEWSLKCSGSKPVSEVQVSIRPALPAVLKPYYREVTIPLPCIGSFGQPADLHGAKMKNMAQVMAARLAVQQSPDGCWQASSYAGNVFPTSIAGLALLSAGDPLYDAQIRKAAYFCAYGTPAPGWSYAQGCRLLFLAEYYLRSRDPGILLGLKTVAAETRRYVLADFTSGHGLGGVGYGGSGYIGGGGMIALGFAAASLTPALDAADKSLLDAMLMRIQELAPAGKVPYGRGGSNESTEDDGHAASCATGPYFLASLIRGGSANFVKAARHRYSQGHYGDVDAGHASMTLHFTMGMLAVAACGEDCYRRAVSTKAWYLTLMRDADGSANSNNYRIEFHGGDGVLGSPYWRTAGMILCLNALKHNLAITGMPEARRQSPQDGPQLFHQDAALRRVLLGNWDLVEVTLGSAAGPAFRQARKDLAAISPERDFSRKFHAFISTGSGHAALAEILRQPQVSQEVAQGQLAELMLGLAIEADCLPDVEPDEEEEGAGGKQVAAADSKAQAKARKKQHKELKKQLEAGAVVDLEYVLHLGIGGFRSISSRFAEASPLPLEDFKAGIRCGGACPIKESLIWQPRYQPASRKEDGGYGEFSRSFPMRSDGIPVFEIDISYRALGLPISYRAKLTGPSPIARGHNPALVRVPVKAQVLEDYAGQYTLLLRLANGNLLPCENHAKVQPPDFLPAGNSVTAWISPETLWGHDLRQVAMGSFASPRELPCQTSGGACVLGDHKLESSVKVGPGESTVELVLGQPGETGLVWVAWKDKDVKRAFQVELKLADGTWQRSACSERPGLISLPHHKCTAMRLVFAPGKALDLAECRLYSPPRIEVQRRLQP
jgi:hypothetical protein